METITTNKKFIKVTTILVALLCLLVLAMFVNQVKGKHNWKNGQVQSTISVTADADVMAIPDVAVINLSIEKEGKTSKEAQNLVNEMVTKTLTYIKDQKIEDKDVKSQYGGVNPKYKNNQIYCITYPCPQGEMVIVGYTATQSITIKIRNADNANEVRTGLANLGITNISGPTFSIDDEDALRDQARSQAIEKARTKAKILAKELHVRLGDVVSFSENGGGYSMMYGGVMMDKAMVSSVPAPVLPKGENKITSSVTITYEIK
ncbi:SIMPL domain-containing protein [Candidatus Nomurabacteria bacterium]|nr:SIMPL domain-containing protein [Candidatus Nomurabacteria bacterium]